nr:hypothetical protein Saspl_051976 [Ipomoea batatas]GMD90460.1 hypothetical protein Saspl_051976 [Ipomoea batatas]
MKQFNLAIKLTKCLLPLPANPLRKFKTSPNGIILCLLLRLWTLGLLMGYWKLNIRWRI